MTLWIGRHIAALGPDGKPAENEVHVEYEITELGQAQVTYDRDGNPTNEPDRVFAILRKIR